MPTFKLSDLSNKHELIYKLNQLNGGGATTLGNLTDVDVSNVTGGQILKYNGNTGTWINSDDNNNYVTQTPSQSSMQSTLSRKVLLSYQVGSIGFTAGEFTNTSFTADDVEVAPSTSKIYARAFVTKNGTSSQFVKGDGTLDSNTYITQSSINISASPGDSNIRGSLAGSVTISGSTVNFIVNPARPNVPTSPSVIENHQGVVRPLIEYNTINMDNEIITSQITGGVVQQGYYSDSIYVATNINLDEPVVFVPITTIYYSNPQTKRYESIPCLVITKENYESNVLKSIYGDPVQLAPIQ